MTIPYRPIAFGLFALAFAALLFERAQAGGSHFFPPVSDPVVREECGSCHLAYAPSMLPARSWQRMTGDLKNHFGDDASVDTATTARITDYLVANAGPIPAAGATAGSCCAASRPLTHRSGSPNCRAG